MDVLGVVPSHPPGGTSVFAEVLNKMRQRCLRGNWRRGWRDPINSARRHCRGMFRVVGKPRKTSNKRDVLEESEAITSRGSEGESGGNSLQVAPDAGSSFLSFGALGVVIWVG